MSKTRKIQSGNYRVKPVSTAELGDDPASWLVAQARNGLTTLLAHVDDGVIWGRVDGGRLLTSHEVFGEQVSPPLRIITLQQARLFGPEAELFLWRVDNGWQARLVQDGVGEMAEFYDEYTMLWGTRLEDHKNGFALVADGAQGMRHAPPVEMGKDAFAGKNHRPLCLQVRHYLTADSNGLLRVTLSRLVRVTTDAQIEEVLQ